MKTFTVKIRYYGLTGEYMTSDDVLARTAESAKKKASKAIGNRDGMVISVCEKTYMEYGQ